MKKIFLCVMCAAALTACNNGANKKDQAFAEERDSLMQVINDKDTELNEIMGTVNEIQEGFRRINEAEGRITVNDGNMESETSKQAIREHAVHSGCHGTKPGQNQSVEREASYEHHRGG